MGKKRSRLTNPEPFLAEDDSKSVSKRRTKPAKQHQQGEQLISSAMSSKIMKEALVQQKEIQEEEEAQKQNPTGLVFSDEQMNKTELDEEEDIDEFQGFSDTQSQYGGLEYEITEEDEKLLEAFMPKDAPQERTLADVILEKIKERDAKVSSDAPALPKLDDSLIKLYKDVGKVLSNYTSGKVPKAFKHIPSVQYWEEILYLTEPEKWSPNSVYQATRIFASKGVKQAERFYKFVLLPRIRSDIQKNKRLHFALYQALKKSMYKAAAFNKGILFPLCESRTCTLREAVIIGSIMEKVRIPHLHSSVALLKLAEMEYFGTTSYFIKLLLDKKQALPYRVLDALVGHFLRFREDSRYKDGLRKEDKIDLHTLIEKQKHRSITPEILRELNNSRNRGEKDDDLMSISSPLIVINKRIEEDRFDVPDVPMEED